MGNKKTLKVFSTASVAGMIATAVLSSQAFAAVDAYSVKVGEDVFQYSKQEIAKSFIEAKRGNDAALYNDFAAKLENAGGFFAFHDSETGYVDFDSIKGKFVEAKREGAEFKVDEFTESSDAKVVEIPTVKKAVVNEDGKVEYTDESEVVDGEVGIKAVTPLNMKQIKVEFNGKIVDSQKKDDVKDVDNYELRNADGDKIEEDDIAFEKAELDESGKFVILTIADRVMANQEITIDGSASDISNDDKDDYVNNQAKYTLVIDENITEKDDVEKEFELEDTDLPEVESAEVVGKDTIKVKFSEPVAPKEITVDDNGYEKTALLDDDTFEINDDDIAVDEVRLCDNHKEANIILASDLKDGEEVKVNVKSKAKDYAGYALRKSELNVEVKENKEELKIVGYKETEDEKITLVFNKDIKFGKDADDDYAVENNSSMNDDFMKNFYHTNTKNVAQTATIDGNELKLTFDAKLSGTVFVYVDADSVQDLWEVKNNDLSIKADIDLDNTRPEVKNVEQGDKDTEIEVKFSEKVKSEDHNGADGDYKDASGDHKDNYTVKDKDGKEVKISKVNLKDEGKKAIITLRDSLDAGDEYTVEVKDVEDKADNRIKDTSVKFKAKGSAVGQNDIHVSAYNAGENDQKIIVDFDAKMKTGDASDSIENLNNYTIEIYKDAAGTDLLDKINVSDYYKAKAKAIADDNKVEITLPGDKADDEDQYDFGDETKTEITSSRFEGEKGKLVKVVVGRVADSEENHSDDIAYKGIAVDFADAVRLNDDDDNLVATAPDTIKVTWGDELDFDKDDVSLVLVKVDEEGKITETKQADGEDLELRASKTDIDKENGVTTVTYTLDDDYSGKGNYVKGNNELNYDGTITLDAKNEKADAGDTYRVAIKTNPSEDIESKNDYDAKLVGDGMFIVDDNIAPDIAKLPKGDKHDEGTMIVNEDAYDDRDDYDDNVTVSAFDKAHKTATLKLVFEEAINPSSLSKDAFKTSDSDIDVSGVRAGEKPEIVYVDLNLEDYDAKDVADGKIDSILGNLGLDSDNSISDMAMTHNYNNGSNEDGNRENPKKNDNNENGSLDLEVKDVTGTEATKLLKDAEDAAAAVEKVKEAKEAVSALFADDTKAALKAGVDQAAITAASDKVEGLATEVKEKAGLQADIVKAQGLLDQAAADTVVKALYNEEGMTTLKADTDATAIDAAIVEVNKVTDETVKNKLLAKTTAATQLVNEKAKVETAVSIAKSVNVGDDVTNTVLAYGTPLTGGITGTVKTVESGDANTYLTLTTGNVTLKAQKADATDASTKCTVTVSNGTESVDVEVTVTIKSQI